MKKVSVESMTVLSDKEQERAKKKKIVCEVGDFVCLDISLCLVGKKIVGDDALHF